jgi:hypothetical protein
MSSRSLAAPSVEAIHSAAKRCPRKAAVAILAASRPRRILQRHPVSARELLPAW